LIVSADSTLVDVLHPSPNVEPRRNGPAATILLLHYTGLPTVERAIDVLSRADCKVSCHYVVDLDGRITQMVPESMRAWHAGVSIWEGETDINSASIGVEIQNVGHDAGYPEFPKRQMKAVAALCRDVIGRHPIPPHRVLAHSDVAPGRKRDPGERFDWKGLARKGIGLWVKPASVDCSDVGLGPGAEDDRVGQLQRQLAAYGYGVASHGRLDEATGIVVAAFQRHFRPARVDGRIDASTETTLARLLAARAAAQLPA
jgi:N-acetylmuramoyl-L-alanine amidase